MTAAEVPASRIFSVADMFADPQFLAREMIAKATMPDGRKLSIPGVVPKLSATPGATDWLGPPLGADNDRVFGELGYTPEQIELFRKNSVI
jgi:formyl-CoA transferase